MKTTIKLIKNRSDIGAGTRGSDLGIDALEIAAINRDNDYFNQYPFQDVKTHNETIYNKSTSTSAKRIEHVLEQCNRVHEVVKSTLQEGFFPIVLSGDHSSALGTLSGIKAAYPDKKIGVFWIDAHADLHSPYTSPSGNIHGMPLSATLGQDNLECQNNDVSLATQEDWEQMKNIGFSGPKVLPENLVYFGVRDTEEEEDKQIERLQIKNYKVAEVRYRGLDVCVAEALNKMNDCDIIYVSFDVDSLDCDMVSYGTGTPVPRGFDPLEVTAMLKQIVASQKVACIEFVEINPLLDTKGNKMAETAFEILEEFTTTLLES